MTADGHGSTVPTAGGESRELRRSADIAAERRLYDAECALHAAPQARVDAWITAAANRLHEAVVAHLAAVGKDRTTRTL